MLHSAMVHGNARRGASLTCARAAPAGGVRAQGCHRRRRRSEACAARRDGSSRSGRLRGGRLRGSRLGFGFLGRGSGLVATSLGLVREERRGPEGNDEDEFGGHSRERSGGSCDPRAFAMPFACRNAMDGYGCRDFRGEVSGPRRDAFSRLNRLMKEIASSSLQHQHPKPTLNFRFSLARSFTLPHTFLTTHQQKWSRPTS